MTSNMSVQPNKPLLLAAIVNALSSLLRSWLGRRSFAPFGRGGRLE